MPSEPAATQPTSSDGPSTGDVPAASHIEVPVADNVPSSGWFALFTGFKYNHQSTFVKNFKRLAKWKRWDQEERKERRVEAVEAEFGTHFGGNMQNLEKWQDLSKICGVEPVPSSVEACKEV